MKLLRALGRITLLIATATILSLLYGIGFVFVGASKRRSVRIRQSLVKYWGKIIAWGLGMKIKTEGPIPFPPFCLVSNHLSYMDVVVYQAVTGSVFISKAEVATWPGVGLLGRLIGTIFIDRERMRDVVRVSAEIQARLNHGESVVFFPEGTTTNGTYVAPFKASLLNYFSEASYPVHYASIRYNSDHFDVSDLVCWWGEMLFAPHFWQLLQQKSFSCFIKFGENPVTDSDRKALTRTLKEKIVTSLSQK